MDLDSMKYVELRCLAKELGIKAYNKMKAEKLLMAIKRHYQQEESVQETERNVDPQVDINESQPLVQDDNAVTDEPVFNPISFVTKRGKGKKSKRNISETELPASKENEVPEAGAGSAKRKRYSPTGGSGAIVPTEISEIGVNYKEQPHLADEVPVGGVTDNGPKARKAGKIPRHEGLLNKSKALKPATPNFKKLHEAHFKKMESIDSYVQRKQKQMETGSNSVKDLKKPPPCRASLFSPALSKPADDKCRQTSASKPVLNKPSQKDDVLFRPSVLSTRRINVRFSQATQDNEHKRTLVKTPARMSRCIALGTPGKQNNDGGNVNPVKTANVSAMKTPGTFVFMGNVSVSNSPGNNKKPCFDLKESLARPLAYKPHKGKLKPFGENGENTAGNDFQISQSHQKKYKQHHVETRDNRRVKHVKDRKQKKEDILGARRGLVMS